RRDPEFELIDSGVFDDDAYYDFVVEYAKAAPDDLLIALSITNRGNAAHALTVLPTLWARNFWSWGGEHVKPALRERPGAPVPTIDVKHADLGEYALFCEPGARLLFTENETNFERLFGSPNGSPYVKDAFHRFVVEHDEAAVNPANAGTKAAALYVLPFSPGQTRTIRLRLSKTTGLADPLGAEFEAKLTVRRAEADEFYAELNPFEIADDLRAIQRQAFAGLLWCKQFYRYVVHDWLRGDPGEPTPPAARLHGRNAQWDHLYADNVLSMPDSWEYPWFAAWDLAFHCIAFAMIDSEFAKEQLLLLTREWFMHPSGQLPAYEWNFNDVNPPVHAWAAYRVYRIEEKMTGTADVGFLERVFQKLLLTFTWWVNRKDVDGSNVFQGGFLGLDNIGIFDRSAPLPSGGHIDQADGTSWMGVFALNMLTIALELAKHNHAYEDIACKFFEHFLYIADAMNRVGENSDGLWNEQDGFYYDVLRLPNGEQHVLRARSLVGAIPLFALHTLEAGQIDGLPEFRRNFQWFVTHRADLQRNVACMDVPGAGERRLLSIVDRA
ncbi:MAG: MGH1-like glycoside hydrolase domain-containing protein, partial [Vulcanimicrobiaceae bacterium]